MLAKFPGFVSTAEIYFVKNYTTLRATDFRKSQRGYRKPVVVVSMAEDSYSSPLKCKFNDEDMKQMCKTTFDPHSVDPDLLQKIVYDALVWSSLNGLVVGDKSSPKSGKVPGIGLIHAPVTLFPTFFPESKWKQASELAPILNELVDRVSLDAEFLQESLSRTRKVDDFTSRLLDIHSKMLEMNKKEEIRLGLHRSDYMVDEKTNLLLQIELNTISSSFPGLSCLVNQLHRYLLHQYKEHIGLNPERIPENNANFQFAEALYKAWAAYNNPKAVVLVVVQNEERNMYDQHLLFTILKQTYNVRSIRKTLGEVGALGKLLSDGTLVLDTEAVSVAYFRAGYSPTDYPSELEWKARLLIEQSSAIKCPSVAYHLAGTKKIQQELAKPHQLERFLDNKDEIAKVRECFAGLWSLDDSSIVSDAKKNPALYVMKPQREGGGNNIYGDEVRIALERMEKGGFDEDAAAYILMQRIFPTISSAVLLREGIPRKDNALSELGIYGAYLRNGDKVLMNKHSGYLMRTKIASSDEGGVAAGFAVLDSIYLTC